MVRKFINWLVDAFCPNCGGQMEEGTDERGLDYAVCVDCGYRIYR